MSIFRCGLWASSGPFPLSAHYGLYKRGRDPPTNPSHHLKKEKRTLSLSQVAAQGRSRKETNRRLRRRTFTCRRCARRRDRRLPLPWSRISSVQSTRRRHCRRRKAAPPPLLLHGPLCIPLLHSRS